MRYHCIFLVCIALLICVTFARSTSLKTRQIYRTIRECQCPLRCIISLRQCLISGMCRMCSLPNYGKRQDEDHEVYIPEKRQGDEEATKVFNM